MKFNEKLIELRKKAGLSQEELGEKLNVTRQTVSKWELGQTTPEMDKLVEMGKIFNVSVDGLINESEHVQNQTESQPKTIENQPIVDNKPKESREKIVVGILVILLVVALALVVGSLANKKAENDVQNQVTEQATGFFDKFFGIFDNLFNKAMEDQEEHSKQMDVMGFNGPLSIYGGSSADLSVRALLDGIITSNKTKDRIITVVYNGVETQDETAMRNIKSEVDGNYEVTFDYDADGYITKVTIERVYTKMDISIFNSPLEISSGTNYGMGVASLLDDIVTINKTKERKITVVYGKTSTQDETEIKNIKKKMDTFTKYDITFEYDEIGFINKMIIEKM